MTLQNRAAGALYGLALGDALGMPTQMLSRPQIVARYGPMLTGFHPAAPDHPLAAGMPAGAITDDTEQALLLARLLLDGKGSVDPAELARRLVAWEEDMRARGSLDLLGPSTKRAVEQVLEGTPVDEVGRYGTTNGAAMRIAPVGIAVASTDPVALVDRVVEASRLTHNTGVALAGAAAVAAAVSAGLDGASVPEAVEVAVRAARSAADRGHWVAAADVAERIVWATELVRGPTRPKSATGSTRWWAPVSRPRSPCPPRSPSSRPARTTRGRRCCWARPSAATATPSPRSRVPSAAPAAAWTPSRPRRGRPWCE